MGCLFNHVRSAGRYRPCGKRKDLQRAGVRIFADQRIFQQRLGQQRLFALWRFGRSWRRSRNTNFDNRCEYNDWCDYDNRCFKHDNNGNRITSDNDVANGYRYRERDAGAHDDRIAKRDSFGKPRRYGAGHGGDGQPDEQRNARRIAHARRIAQQQSQGER